MRFDGGRLRAILAYQTEPVVVRNGFGRPEVEYENPRAALAVLRRGSYYGVGHAKRIRFLQPVSVEDRVVPWGAELDFEAPSGAGFQYLTRRGTTPLLPRVQAPMRRAQGGRRNSTINSGSLTRSAVAVVEAPQCNSADAPLPQPDPAGQCTVSQSDYKRTSVNGADDLEIGVLARMYVKRDPQLPWSQSNARPVV
jgi:hypothetical protein